MPALSLFRLIIKQIANLIGFSTNLSGTVAIALSLRYLRSINAQVFANGVAMSPESVPYSTPSNRHVAVIGGGLSGCEAALQLANQGIPVKLYDMKPSQRPIAHHTFQLAEIVCSNSLGNLQLSTATGLLKWEMEALHCQLLAIAKRMAVPAGNALAVDRDGFSREVTETIDAHPHIERVDQDVNTLPTDAEYVVIATGPLTSEGLTQTLQTMLNQQQLYFFDAAAPIVTRDSINFERAFFQDRYATERNQESAESTTDAGNTDECGNYINCPLSKEEYTALIDAINTAERIELKSFEQEEAKKAVKFFESCLPIEELARRGIDTPRYGPMKPVGIVDPHTQRRPWAVVQLRQDNAEGTLYNLVGFQTNLKWGDQKQMIQMIPGLENAEIVRYGVMHRNTFLNSPEVLTPTLQLKLHPKVFIAGQLTGVEGYTECIATGMLAGLSIAHLWQNPDAQPLLPPAESMLGSLCRYITRSGVTSFQPINSNWGLLPELNDTTLNHKKNRALRNQTYAERSQQAFSTFKQHVFEPLTKASLSVV